VRDQHETKIEIVLLMSALAWTLSNACLSAPLLQKRAEKGWALVQAHFVEKQLSLHVSSHGVRIDSLRETWGIICVPPDWDAIVFSRGDKTICHVPYKRWSKLGVSVVNFNQEVPVLPKTHLARQSRDAIRPYGGLSVTHTSWKGSASTAEDLMFQAQVRPRVCTFALETTPLINAPLQVRQLLSQFYRVPETSEFPIGYSNSFEARPLLHTLDLRHVDVPDDVFAPPVGFRTVQSETDVWLNDGDKAKINDLGELMGAPGK